MRGGCVTWRALGWCTLPLGVPEVDNRVALDAETLHLFCVNAANADHGSVQVLASREIAAPEGGTVRVAVHGGRDGVRARVMVEGLAADLRAGRHDLSPHRPVPLPRHR